jgi:hypothetical protein
MLETPRWTPNAFVALTRGPPVGGNKNKNTFSAPMRITNYEAAAKIEGRQLRSPPDIASHDTHPADGV